MNETALSLLERRRNRAIAIVLGVKEREVDQYLSQPLRDKLRKVVLDQFNDYHETTMDVLRSLDDGSSVTFNQIYLDMLEDLHKTLVET